MNATSQTNEASTIAGCRTPRPSRCARDIAEETGVTVRTVFSSFPRGKLQVFHDALNVAVAGDEEPIPVADRDEVRESLTDPDRIVDALADMGTTIQERAGRLIMTMIESSGADQDIQRLASEGESTTTANMRTVAEALNRFGLLRNSVDVDRATDMLVALCSPHVHHILRQTTRLVRCGIPRLADREN